MYRNWKKAGLGLTGATAIIVSAGIVFAPAAMAAPAAPAATPAAGCVTTGGLSGVVTLVNNLLGGSLLCVATTTSTTSTNGGLTVGVGGDNGLGVTLGGTSGVGVNLGGTNGVGVSVGGPAGTAVTVGTPGGTGTNGTDGTNGTNGGTGTNSSTNTGTTTSNGSTTSTGSTSDTSSGTTSGSTTTGTTTGGGAIAGTAAKLTALSATASAGVVYPFKDGYKDSITFKLKGIAADGVQRAATGTATLTYGSTKVLTWKITRTDQKITWNGRKGGKIVPGRYVFTAKATDASGAAVTGTESVTVSSKKLVAATTTLKTKALTGSHKLPAKPRAGLAKAKVTLKVISSVTGVKGKQYLVFSHAGKKVKVLIHNGTHTAKAVTIPKTFTSYKLTHTWKSGVTVKSLKYKYSYKVLK